MSPHQWQQAHYILNQKIVHGWCCLSSVFQIERLRRHSSITQVAICLPKAAERPQIITGFDNE